MTAYVLASGRIDKRVPSAADAVAGVHDGATVLVSGFGEVGVPCLLIDPLIDYGPTDLTVVSHNAGAARPAWRPGTSGRSPAGKLSGLITSARSGRTGRQVMSLHRAASGPSSAAAQQPAGVWHHRGMLIAVGSGASSQPRRWRPLAARPGLAGQCPGYG